MTEKNKKKQELKERRKPAMPKPLRTKSFEEKKRSIERKHKSHYEDA